MLEAGIATRDEIDISMKMAVNHPMGPLEVVDFIGLDTELSIAESLYEETKEAKYAPTLLLRRLGIVGWWEVSSMGLRLQIAHGKTRHKGANSGARNSPITPQPPHK
jgi:3-hydroxyacyl-CoA dehydrogenase